MDNRHKLRDALPRPCYPASGCWAIAWIAAAVACTTPNPNFRRPDADVSCHSATDCSGTTAVCDLSGGAGTGTCVQCTATDHLACTATTPVCGTDHTCRSCTAHSECASNACLPDGSCSDGSDVAYVAPGGSGASCAQSSPCASVMSALAAHKNFIKISGSLSENVTITDQNVTILADPGAKLSAATNYLVNIVGSSQVAIYDLELGPSGLGLQIPQGASVSLRRVTLHDMHSSIDLGKGTLNISQSTIRSNEDGITAFGGTITISQSTFSDNDRAMYVDGGTLNISRSTIRSNRDGGIYMATPTTFHITNNFIHHNGSRSSLFGGVHALPVGNSTLEFNTIVYNSSDAAMGASGVVCTQAGFMARNNLLFGNTTATSGTCTFVPLPTDTNPNFVNPAENNYHLSAATPATILDAVDCSGNAEDVDGDARPQGAKCDLGADEFKPTT